MWSSFNRRRSLTTLLIALLMGCAQAALTASAYHIGAGDKLTIKVYGEPGLSLDKVKVPGEGTLSFPLIGEIRVEGRTTAGVQQTITQRLADGYLRDPEVTVSVVEYRPFYVHGEVKSPGAYPWQEGLTAEKAIALAGGFSERASRDKVNLAREESPDDVRKSVPLDTPVGPGDIVTVGESFF